MGLRHCQIFMTSFTAMILTNESALPARVLPNVVMESRLEEVAAGDALTAEVAYKRRIQKSKAKL